MAECKNCKVELEDIYDIFCSVKCQEAWYYFHELVKGEAVNVARNKYEIDKELYIKWLNEKEVYYEPMTPEEIINRIEQIAEIEFYAAAEWEVAHKHLDKKRGRNSISPHLKADRNKLITDPKFTVNLDGEPRKKEKKEKKPKEDFLSNILGTTIEEAKRELREMKRSKELDKAEPVKSEPVKSTQESNQEDNQSKANDIMERIRLAKLARG